MLLPPTKREVESYYRTLSSTGSIYSENIKKKSFLIFNFIIKNIKKIKFKVKFKALLSPYLKDKIKGLLSPYCDRAKTENKRKHI